MLADRIYIKNTYPNKLVTAPLTRNMIDNKKSNIDSSTDFNMILLQYGSNFMLKLLSDAC